MVFDWLQQQINASDASKLSVKFDVKVEKDPVCIVSK